ncbi:MAG: universal stress protein [Gammaproteobacteria bacterium]|nr:universal stress protein [Gammaproteobacteria bacterium]
MKLLVATTQSFDPLAIATQLARRFDLKQCDIDVLHVVGGGINNAISKAANVVQLRPVPPDPHAPQMAMRQLSEMLQQYYEARTVRTHLERGDKAGIVLEFSRARECDVLILTEPHGHSGTLLRDRQQSARRILDWAPCTVQILRQPDEQAGKCSVLIPLPCASGVALTSDDIRAVGMDAGSCVHLLGIMPPSIDEQLFEASPAALLRTIQQARDAAAAARAQLERISRDFLADTALQLHFEHSVAEGEWGTVALKAVRRLRPQTLVLNRSWDPGLRAIRARHDTAYVALTAACTTLFIDAGQRMPVPAGRTTQGRRISVEQNARSGLA